jgi:hypothetical protein
MIVRGEAQARLGVRALLEDRTRAVGRTVIDCHDLVIGEGLASQAIQTFLEKRGRIVNGQEYGNLGLQLGILRCVKI